MSEFGVPTDEQLAKINKLAKRNLTKEEVFVFPNKLAGDMIIPDRYIQLTKELLDVFSNYAKQGVSLLLDHSWAPDGLWGMGGRPKPALPYGRTFDSKYETSTEEGETISLVADHYMKRDIELDGIKTDDLIASIEAGTLFDSSIGFSYSKAICSVCGDNYYNCNHYKGKTYEIENEDGTTSNKLCYVKAKPPGFLMENSLVFDGAYPTAGVLSKAGTILENENGTYQVINDLKDIDPAKTIFSTYSNRGGLLTMVKKSDHKKPYSLGGIKDEKLKGAEKPMDEKTLAMLKELGIEYKEGETKSEELFSKIAEKWESSGATEPTEPTEPTDEFMSKEKVSEKLGKELSADDVLKLAKEGQEYHKTLSDEALATGVRAMGNDFPKETWEKSFTSMDTNAIKDITKTWELQANAGIPAGRHTNPSAGETQSQDLPDEAFM